MELTGRQKKYLKKNLRKKPLEKIAIDLKISKKEILQYLKSHWRKEKYRKFTRHLRGVSPAQTSSSEKECWRESLHPGNGIDLKKWLKNNWKGLAFLTFLVFTVYFNSLGHDFVSDDIAAIRDHPLINNSEYIVHSDFNPRAIIIFFIHKVFGPAPVFYRLSNIFSHLGNCFLIYFLLNLFFGNPIPLMTASIFAVHPILTESVTWISGGPYSNSTFFVLLAFIGYIFSTHRRKKWPYFFSLFFFFLAFLTNSKLIIFPLILLLYEFYLGPPVGGKIDWPKLIPFWLISGVGVLYLIGLVGPRVSSLETTSYQEPGLNNPLIQIPIAISEYLKLIFWPQNLAFYHSEMAFTRGEYILHLVVFVFFLAILGYFFKKNRQLFFWLSVFPISLLITLTPLKVGWTVAERYVYFGTLGVIVIIAFGIQKISLLIKRPKVTYVFLGMILLALSVRTIIRNGDWKNQDTLWLATAKTSPSSYQNHNNLGDLYIRRGDLEKAITEFQRALELKPNYADAYHNLANAYHQMEKDDLAIENYQKALSFNANLWQSHQNLAAIYFNQKEYQIAKKNLQKATEINPQNTNLLVKLAVIQLVLGEKERAEESLRKALLIDPQNQQAKQIMLSL